MQIASILAPMVSGLVSMLLPRGAANGRTVVSLLGMLIAFAGVIFAANQQAGVEAAVVGVAYAPSVELSLSFYPDSLGVFFAALIAGMGAAIVLYARGFFGSADESLRRFFPTLGFFATAMLGLKRGYRSRLRP